MPEGDAVYRTAHRLDRALSSDVLVLSDFRWPSLATTDLRGSTVLVTAPRGKHLLTRLDSGLTVHSHLRMDGSWRVVPAGRRPPGGPRIRVILGTQRQTAVGIQLGMLDVLPTAEESRVVGHLGPDLLDPGWTDADLATAVVNLERDPDAPIATALLDQRNLAGLGTIWTAEPLFACGISPVTPAKDVPDLTRLVTTARRLIRTAALTDLRPRPNVFQREGSPCRVCGTTITSVKVGPKTQERGIFFCPSCQS